MRNAIIFLSSVFLFGCVVAEPEPVTSGDEPEPVEALDCVDVSPFGEVGGPAALFVMNECGEPVDCDVLGAGIHWLDTLQPGESWSTPQEVCGSLAGWCVDSSGAEVVWAWDIACTS